MDYFIGSVHHVHSIPIDYDADKYAAAVAASSRKDEESLFEDYYDLHFSMLQTLRPKVVGHFDLIRLMSKEPERDVRRWPGVWDKIIRNLKTAKEQGGWLECNSAGLRKGLAEPYPCRSIAEVSPQIKPRTIMEGFPLWLTVCVIGMDQDGGQVYHV